MFAGGRTDPANSLLPMEPAETILSCVFLYLINTKCYDLVDYQVHLVVHIYRFILPKLYAGLEF
jgi:hypothetical protein